MTNAPSRRKRTRKPAAERHCLVCGDLLSDLTLERVLDQVRSIAKHMPAPEPHKPEESLDQWLDRLRNADRDQITVARCRVALLVDDADGYCTTCSPRYAALDAAYRRP